ncbi:MAG TPA: hypothetical protein VMU95_14975 [Trebonia sp.]|nr:hypothetical protein [Trebonia sp.]
MGGRHHSDPTGSGQAAYIGIALIAVILVVIAVLAVLAVAGVI